MRNASAKAGIFSASMERSLRESQGRIVHVSKSKISCTSSGRVRRSSIHSKITIKAKARTKPTSTPITVFDNVLGLTGVVGSSAGKICNLPGNCVFTYPAKLWLTSFASCFACWGSVLCTSSSMICVPAWGFTESIALSWFIVSPLCCTTTRSSTVGLVSNWAYVGKASKLAVVLS